MAIFGYIETEDIVQENDKFRISAHKSYVSKDESAITAIEIEPEAGAGFINVYNIDSDNWYLDWEYTTDGTKTISLRVTTDGAPVTITKDITCLTEADDKLFSTDQDLFRHETDILKYVPRGKNTYKFMHRLAQTEILEQLYKDGYTTIDNLKLTKDNVIRIDELTQWSKFVTLRIIFRNLSNAIDDIYDRKSKSYQNDEHMWRTKAILKLDFNGDGEQGEYEYADITTRKLLRV